MYKEYQALKVLKLFSQEARAHCYLGFAVSTEEGREEDLLELQGSGSRRDEI